MAQFEVTIRRITEQTTKLSISATSEDEAESKAEALISQPGWAASSDIEWSLKDETDEIESIDEE